MSLFGGNNEDLTLTVKAKDEASGPLGVLNQNVLDFAKGTLIGNEATKIFDKSMTFLRDTVLDCIKAYEESESIIAQTNAVLTSTGHAAGMSAEELITLSKAFQAQTTYSDEAVLSAENLLLTFTSIQKDVFPQTTQVVLDMSAALGQDLKSSAIQVGKALQDPTIGITALQRVGVNFTAAQKETINTLIKTNQTFQAQQLILGELSREFGGSAAAAATTFQGRMEQLKNRVNDLQETIGHGLTVEMSNMISAFDQATGAMSANVDIGKQTFEVFSFITEAAANTVAGIHGIASAIVEMGSYAAEALDVVGVALDGDHQKFEDFRSSVADGDKGFTDFALNLKNSNTSTLASWDAMTAASGKFAAKGPAAYEQTAQAAADAKKKIDEVNKSMETTITSLNDLLDTHTDDLASSRQKVGEDYVAQQQKIADLQKQLGQSTDDAERVRLQNQIEDEQKSLASHYELEVSYATEIAEAKRRASETDFDRQLEDQKKQDEIDKKAFLKKEVQLLQDLLEEKQKQQTIMDGEAQVTAVAVSEGAKRTADVISNTNIQIAAVNRYAAAAAAAYTSAGGFTIAAAYAPKHEFGGLIDAPIGTPVPIIAHGQERVIPAGQSGAGGGSFSLTINNPSVRSDADIEKLRSEMEKFFRQVVLNYKYA